MSRVSTDTSSAQVGVIQFHALLNTPHLPWGEKLCVLDVDSGYSNKNFLEPLQTHKSLVTIARCRSNRVFYQRPVPSDAPPKRGHPVWHGERFALKDEATWHEPDVLIHTTETTQKGRGLNVTIQAWHNMLMRGNKPHPMHKHSFTLLRIERVDEAGKTVGSPMWLIVIGEQRHQLSPSQAYQAYRQRFELEHTFRFQKRNLLLDAFQTPESEHEQQWIHLVMLAYVQLWNAHRLAQAMPRPWERALKTEPTARISPSNVQRDWNRIISQLGSPATAAKPRGKSPGRQSGQTQTPRTRLPVIQKAQGQNTHDTHEKKVV
ncbi:MAG: transposase [Cyanobacteria bacterium P01_H01_bin.152]